MARNESTGFRGLAHLVSYTSDSDEERGKDEEEEEEEEEKEEGEMKEEGVMKGGEVGEVEIEGQTELPEAEVKREPSEVDLIEEEDTFMVVEQEASKSKPELEVKPLLSDASEGQGSQDEGEPRKKRMGLVSYDGEDDEGRRDEEEEDEEEGDPDDSWSEVKPSPTDPDLEERVKVSNIKFADNADLSASMSLPESALSQKIRRLSADEVQLPPEPQGRCSRHLQEKINSYYRKNLNLNQIIQRRKDFRNPSIYEKLINFAGVDELGTNYPKDMYDPYSWGEESYYDALAKAQREEIQKKKEKEKKEKGTKVEFVTGMARKPQIQAPVITSTTGVAPPPLLPVPQGSGHEEEKKRKSKWDNPVQSLPPPVPLMQRPLLSLVSTTITAPSVGSTTTSATRPKTTVISSIGTIKKQKLDK